MIDTHTDVFANSWLLNGLDNSTGARWYLRYRSMTDIDGVTADCVADMTTWGQEYNHGEVTLGNVGNFLCRAMVVVPAQTARGTTISRSISIARRPLVTQKTLRVDRPLRDLSLFYTADPSKRMSAWTDLHWRRAAAARYAVPSWCRCFR